MMHKGHTQVTPVYNRVTRGSHPGRARVRPNCPSLYLPMPGHINPINTCCSAPPPPHPVRGWVAVARKLCTNVISRLLPSHTWVEHGVRPGHALATKLHSRNTRCTAGPRPGRAAVMHESRPEYTRPLPGNTWETPSAHRGYTRKPGGSAGTRVVPHGKTSSDTSSDTPGTPK